MSAPVFFDIVQEANPIGRSIPEIERQNDSVRDLQEQAEQARLALLKKTAELLRAADRLIEKIQESPSETKPPREVLIAQIREHRRQAFERMVELNPDQAWFWTEEWQAGERAIDRDIAAGVPGDGPMTGDEFLAELDAAIARKG
jgi:hypothetical protein